MLSKSATDSRLRPTLTLPVADACLRPWQQPTDAAALVACANDAGVAQNLRDAFPHPYTVEDANWYLNFVRDPTGRDVHLAIDVAGTAAGAISLIFKDDISRRGAEIGYWLGRQHWGQGIATAAVRELSEYALANFDLCRLYAIILAENTASARVLEKSGYELEGRLRQSITKAGRTMDALIYALVR